MYQLKVSINQNRPFWTKVSFAIDHEPVPICSGPLFSLVKTLRGTGSSYLRASLRYGFGPSVRSNDIGFRCAWD